MTGSKENNEFCFHETLNVEVDGKQNSLFPARLEKTAKKLFNLRRLINLQRFQGVRPDHVRIEFP